MNVVLTVACHCARECIHHWTLIFMHAVSNMHTSLHAKWPGKNNPQEERFGTLNHTRYPRSHEWLGNAHSTYMCPVALIGNLITCPTATSYSHDLLLRGVLSSFQYENTCVEKDRTSCSNFGATNLDVFTMVIHKRYGLQSLHRGTSHKQNI